MRKIHGDQIQDDQIKDKHVAPNAAIAQSKIQDLPKVSNSVKAFEMLKQVEETSISYIEYDFDPVSNKLQQVDVWRDLSKTEHLFTKVYTYTSGKLTTLVITRHSDSYAITMTFTYTPGGLLSSKEIVDNS